MCFVHRVVQDKNNGTVVFKYEDAAHVPERMKGVEQKPAPRRSLVERLKRAEIAWLTGVSFKLKPIEPSKRSHQSSSTPDADFAAGNLWVGEKKDKMERGGRRHGGLVKRNLGRKPKYKDHPVCA
jgi:hypothetical protein